MNLETTFAYATHHSESIIQWVFLAILLLSGLLIARGLFGKKDSEATAGAGAGAGNLAAAPELQTMISKIMEQTTKLESLNLKDMPPAEVAAVDVQVQTLKKDLSAREAEIAQLKAAGPSTTAEQAAALDGRIKELEAKLAEYEILEDDIADLSLYKEENVRLRAELEKIKGGGAPAPAPEAAAPAPTSPPPPAPEPVAETVPAAVPAAAPEPAPPAPASAPMEMKIPDTGDPMKDFESTVQLERAMQNPAPAPVPTPAVAKPAPAPPAAAPSAPAEAEDLFAEFSTPAPDTDSSLDGSSLDTDKMMSEMAALVSMEPSADSALDQSIDIEKMAAEAKGPNKT